jgi:hypothetical protein
VWKTPLKPAKAPKATYYTRQSLAPIPKRPIRAFAPASTFERLRPSRGVGKMSTVFSHDFPGMPASQGALTAGTGFNTEPCFVHDSPSFLYASGGPNGPDQTGGRYPILPKDPTALTDDEKVIKEPAYLLGDDYSLQIDSPLLSRGSGTLWSGDSTIRGEFFEPSVGRSRDPRGRDENFRTAFSCYMPEDVDSTPYKVVPAGITVSEVGPAVRVIGYSDDLLSNPNTTPRPGITKILQPQLIGIGTRVVTDDAGAQTKFTYPIYAPDGSPAVFPGNPRFIVFASLRGGSGYTSLYLWDTSKNYGDSGEVRRIVGIAGKSILHPRFSPDGKYLAFSVTDIKFDPVEFVPANGVDIGAPQVFPDFVFNIDCVAPNDPASPVQTAFKSYVGVMPFRFGYEYGFTGGNDLSGGSGSITRISNFTIPDPGDPTGVKKITSRDWMPFWSEENQLGFSSDRQDLNGDGYGDAVNPDPAAGRFSIYTFSHPYSPDKVHFDADLKANVYEDSGTPDLSPSFQMVGDPTTKTSNEMLGAWVPLEPGWSYWYGNTDAGDVLGDNALAVLAPRLLAVSDADPADPTKTGAPNLWGSDRTVPTDFSKGNVLTSLPTVAFETSGNKQGTPGEVATISAPINTKLGTLLDRNGDLLPIKVYAVIKDPDNKLFNVAQTLWGIKTANLRLSEVDSNIITMIYREINCEPVSYDVDSITAFDAKYPTDADKYPANPDGAQIGAIVELTPSATDATVYTGKWFSPMEASDYIIDIIVSPADITAPTFLPIISDNIQGCTTAPFVPYSPILMVSDFAQGQQSVPYTTKAPTTAGVPTESYLTERPHADWCYLPGGALDARPVTTQSGWVGLGPRYEFQTGTLVENQTKVIPVDPTDPTSTVLYRSDLDPTQPAGVTTQPMVSIGQSGPYDLWRTQCRLPITLDTLKQYLPYTQLQAGYPDSTVPREQRVADRSVFWFAPHAGQLGGSAGIEARNFGTLANFDTQAEIVKYLNRGGRMLLAGDDVAFTLAQNIPGQPNGVLDFFKVKFDTGKATDVDSFDYQWFRTALTPVNADNQQGLNPIPYVAWNPTGYHFGNDLTPNSLDLAPFYSYPKGTYLNNISLPLGDANINSTHEDGALTNLFIDSIVTKAAATGSWNSWSGQPIFTYNDGSTGAIQTEAPLLLLDAATKQQENTARSKTLFFAFGLEGVNRTYRAQDADDDMATGHYHARNTLAELLHNAVDFLNTGSIVGHTWLNGTTTPINNVLVRAYDDYRARSKGFLHGTTLSGPSTLYPGMAAGAYRIEGMDASVYRLDAYAAGYNFVNTGEAYVFGGLNSPQTNLYLVPVPAGTLNGVVTDASSANPVAGASVHVRDISGQIDRTVTTDAEGKYSFAALPAGIYDADVKAVGYNDYQFGSEISVLQGPNVTTQNFQIGAATPPGTVEGAVTDGNGAGIADAQVTLQDQNGVAVTPKDGGANPVRTGPDGKYSFVVDAGTYTVLAELTDFDPQTKPATVTSAGTTTVNFTFSTTPLPTILTGVVKDDQGAALKGAKVSLLDGDGALVTLTGQDNPATTGDDGKYTFTLDAGGSFQVKVEADTFDAQTKPATVVIHETTTVDFDMVKTVVTGTLTGTVTDSANGTLISGATVRVRNADSSVDQSVTTGADGVYSVANLPAGPYTVDASAVGYDAYTTTEPVEVAAGPAVTTHNIALNKTIVVPDSGTLQVSVVSAANTPSVPLANANVTVYDQSTSQIAVTLDGGANPATTNGSGQAAFKLAPGAYTAVVAVTPYATQTKAGTVQKDKTTTLSFTFGAPLHIYGAGKVLLASAPYDYTGSDLAAVLAVTSDSLKNAVVAFDASQNFVFYPTFPADTFHVGRGYGLKLTTDGIVRTPGTAAAVGTDNYFVMQLNAGWNLIGNPFTTAIPWDDSDAGVRIRVAFGGTVGTKSFKISDAMTSGYILSPLWGGYNDIAGSYKNGYQTINALAPWEARWVKVGQPLMLAVPKPTTTTAASLASRTAVVHTPLLPAANIWAMNVTAAIGGLVDDDLGLGVATRGTAGVDAGLDLAKPNPMDANSATLYTAFAQSPNAYATDVRGATGNETWRFHVTTNIGRQSATLTWHGTGALPAGTTLTLVDPSANKTVDMTKLGAYQYQTARYGESREFRVELRGPKVPGRR